MSRKPAVVSYDCDGTNCVTTWRMLLYSVSYSGIFWHVKHSSPINHQEANVFHQIQNTVCLLKTTVHSVYVPENGGKCSSLCGAGRRN